MDSLRSMNNALEYIEEHLTEEIDYIEVSKIAYCSEYHFKRMRKPAPPTSSRP